MLSFSLPFHTFPPSLFLSSLTHTFTTFLPLSFYSFSPSPHSSNPHFISPCTQSQFFLSPSIHCQGICCSSYPAERCCRLSSTNHCITQRTSKENMSSSFLSSCSSSYSSSFSSSSFSYFSLLLSFFFSLLSCPHLLSYSHPSPPLYSLFSFYCPLPSCSKSSLSTTTSFSTTNCSSSLFFLLLHKIYFTLPSLSCLLSNHRQVHSKRDSVPVMSCYWQFRDYWRSKEMSSLPSTRAMITN